MKASDLPLRTFVRFAAMLAVLFVTFYFLRLTVRLKPDTTLIPNP
jgi:hypothetical protein